MNNRTISIAIISFAIVASLLTMYRQAQHMSVAMPMSEPINTTLPEDITFALENSSASEPAYAPMVGEMGMMRNGTSMMYQKIDDTYTMPPVIGTGTDALDVEDRVYDKTASQGVVVSEPSVFSKQMKSYIESVGGKVISLNQNTYNGMEFVYMSTRVPSEKFDDVTSMVSTKAKKVVNQNINVTDVTGTKVILEEKLQSLDERKAKKATELSLARTDLERKRIQAEIDSIDAQLQIQKKRQDRFTQEVQYSTVVITAADSERYFNPQMRGGMLDELRRAWHSLGGTSRVIATFFIWLGVYSVVMLPLILGVRWLLQFSRHGKSAR